jgi:hypothetical protein
VHRVLVVWIIRLRDLGRLAEGPQDAQGLGRRRLRSRRSPDQTGAPVLGGGVPHHRGVVMSAVPTGAPRAPGRSSRQATMPADEPSAGPGR